MHLINCNINNNIKIKDKFGMTYQSLQVDYTSILTTVNFGNSFCFPRESCGTCLLNINFCDNDIFMISMAK